MSDSLSTQPREPSLSDIALKTISALGTASGEIFDSAGSFGDLLRAATRHCRRLVDGARVDAACDNRDAGSERLGSAHDNELLGQETQRRPREKQALIEVGKSLATPRDLDAVLEAILKSLRQVVRSDAAAIYLVSRSAV